MKTVLVIKIIMLPLALLFAAAGAGHALAGLVAGAALSGALSAWRWRRGALTQIEGAVLVVFLLGLLATLAGQGDAGTLMMIAYAVLAAMSLLSVARGKPWTAEFSKGDFEAQARTPLFLTINRAISFGWGIIFAALALIRLLALPGWVTGVLVGLGIVLSAAGPKLLIRTGIRRMMAQKEPYRWPMPAIRPSREGTACDVAVIGAGLGGLTAAALLAESGAKVQVVEQHVLAGGFSHHWPRRANADGRKLIFRFDSGVHDFSGVHEGGSITGLLKRLNAPAIEWLPLDHRYHLEGLTLDVPRGDGAFAALLAQHFPHERAGIEAFFAEMKQILAAMYAEAPACSGVPGPPRSIEALLAFPQRHPLAMEWMNRPFLDFVRRHIADAGVERILFALGGYISDDALQAPVRAMAPIIGYHIWGGGYPRGGSGKVAQALVEVIERNGGSVRLGTPVSRIMVENGQAAGLVLPKGELLRAGAVISNADLKGTMLGLLGAEHLPQDYAARIAALRPACSAMMVHLGLRGPLEGAPVVHVASGLNHAGFVSPSIVDPSAAPEGYATMELMKLVPNAQAREWFRAAQGQDLKRHRRSEAYLAAKTALTDAMIEAACVAVPDLKERIVFRADASPLTFHRYDLSSDGSIYGMEGFEGEPLKSPLPGLVIAGSANHGAGAEAVMIAGAHAAELFVPGVLATRA